MAFLFHLIDKIIILIRFKVTERQIFQFPLDVEYAQAMRQRGKYFQSFLGNPLLFVASHVAERPHIMKPVCQFYDDDADIFCHSQEHFTHAVELLVFFCTIIKPAQFRYAIDQKCDFLAELSFDIIQRQSRVFHYIMKK